MNINMKVTVSRPSATAGSSGTQELLNVWPVTWDTAASFANAIALVNKTKGTRLPNFYSPYIINQGPRVAFFNQIAGDPTLDTEDCSMEIRRERDDILGTDVWYWCLKCNSIFSSGQFPNNSAAYPEWPCLTRDQNCGDFNFEQYPTAYTPVPMYFVAYSDPVPTSISFLPNVGIIAIYTSFIIVIGRTFRGMFAGTTQNVIQTSMADPKPVSQLIEYIATARQCGDFKLEQSLYFELIDLLRSPERLLAVTGRNRRLYDDLGVAVTVHATSELVPAISESHDNNAETETV
jgi:hypothetical protein